MCDQAVHPEADRFGGWMWLEPTRGEHFRRCSYCGSIHPMDLVAEPEWTYFSWADRKYGWPHKLYVDVPNRTPDRLYVISASSTLPDLNSDQYIAWEDLSDEQRDVVTRDGWGGMLRIANFFQFGTHPTHSAKFYSVHLRDAALPAAAKRLIEHRSGVVFTFTDEGVRFEPATGTGASSARGASGT